MCGAAPVLGAAPPRDRTEADLALITYEQLAAYPGFEGLAEADVTAVLEGASALVELVASPVELEAATLPPAIVPVLVGMVRRGVRNPLGRSGEQLGDYGWQSAGGGAELYATPREERIIRRAVGQLSVGTVTLEGDFPLPPSSYGGEYEYRFLDSFGG